MPGLLLTYAWLAVVLVAGPAVPDAPDTGSNATVEVTATPDPVSPSGTAAGTGPVGSVSPQPDGTPVEQDPVEVLRRTSAAYEEMRAIQAGFTQVLRNTLLGRTTESAGMLYQREPDRFLMDFSDPEGDLIVSDGRYFWMYFPSVDEKQVLRSPRRGQGLDLHAQFIGDPLQRFDHTYHGTEVVRGRSAHVLTLVPKAPAGYQRMKVWIDAEDYLVRRFELTEGNGNIRHLELRDLVVNPTLADSLFEFTPPADAIVVDRG